MDDFAQILDEDVRRSIFEDNLTEYQYNYSLVTAISMSMAYAFLMRIIYNAYQKSDEEGAKVAFDRWANLDIVSAVATLIIFPFMANSPVEVFIEKSSKDQLDYITCLLIALQFGRFFSFMYMIEELSKMMITLKTML